MRKSQWNLEVKLACFKNKLTVRGRYELTCYKRGTPCISDLDYTNSSICLRTGAWQMNAPPFYRMYYVCGERPWFRQGEKEVQLEKGCFYVLPVMQPLLCGMAWTTRWKLLWFHVEVDISLAIILPALKFVSDENCIICFTAFGSCSVIPPVFRTCPSCSISF